MNCKVYNKLIRDRIPEKIAANGARAAIHALAPEAFLKALKEKVIEEAEELATATDKDALTAEIADVQEVLEALIEAAEIDPSALAQVKAEKASRNGAFRERLFLEYTEE